MFFLFLESMQKLVQSLRISTVSDSIIYSLLDHVAHHVLCHIQLKEKAMDFMPMVNAPVTIASADVLKVSMNRSRYS